MPATQDDSFLAELIRAQLAEHASEARARGIVFHCEFEPDLASPEREMRTGDHRSSGGPDKRGECETAVCALIRFVIATIPDGCEVYLALARPAVPAPAPLALVGALAGASEGSAELTLRWQVAGDRRAGPETEVVALRPRLGDAQAQILGKSAQALRADFRAAGWPLALEAIQGGEEIWVRVEVS